MERVRKGCKSFVLLLRGYPYIPSSGTPRLRIKAYDSAFSSLNLRGINASISRVFRSFFTVWVFFAGYAVQSRRLGPETPSGFLQLFLFNQQTDRVETLFVKCVKRNFHLSFLLVLMALKTGLALARLHLPKSRKNIHALARLKKNT